MVSIGRKNLFHDKKRLFISILGLITAFFLIFYGIGTLDATSNEVVCLIDNTESDLWIIQEGNTDIFSPSVLRADSISELDEIDGITEIEKLLYFSVELEMDGEILKECFMIGYDIESRNGRPWNIVNGNHTDLAGTDTIFVDQSIEGILGRFTLGESIEVKSQESNTYEIVGKSKYAKSFTSPYVFTSYENALKIAPISNNQTNIIMIQIAEGYSIDNVRTQINDIDGLSAFIPENLSQQSVDYLIFESSTGLAFVMSTIIGLAVGLMVIILTIYTSTSESIPEFGTLKAIGASKRDLNKIIFEQVFWTMTIGFVVGAIFSKIVMDIIGYYTLMPTNFSIFIFPIILGTALIIAFIGGLNSIKQVHKIDPAIVFKQ